MKNVANNALKMLENKTVGNKLYTKCCENVNVNIEVS